MTSFATTRRKILASLALVAASLVSAAAQEGRGFYKPPAPGTYQSVHAEHGLVVAQEKISARIGADILKRGGNAVDASVASGAMITSVKMPVMARAVSASSVRFSAMMPP